MAFEFKSLSTFPLVGVKFLVTRFKLSFKTEKYFYLFPHLLHFTTEVKTVGALSFTEAKVNSS